MSRRVRRHPRPGVPVFSEKAARLLARGVPFVDPPEGPDCTLCHGKRRACPACTIDRPGRAA